MKKWIVAFIVSGMIFTVFFKQIPQNFIKRTQLINFYSKLINYSKSQNYEGQYDLFSPERKENITLEDYMSNINVNNKQYSIDYKVYSYSIKDNEGLIDSTMIVCQTSSCTGTDRYETRSYKKYIYINGTWYIPDGDNTVYCTRDEPYPMPPEFERAISLIIQRFNQRVVSTGFDENIQSIKNCLHISYSPDVKNYNAEGLFYFDENSTREKLNILVSDTYKANDDILTALLLTHEITHALQYVYNDSGTCFEKEASAFFYQVHFFIVLNKAEQNSLVARATVGGSAEVDHLFDFMERVIKLDRSNPYGSILRVVKANPYYQEQCGSN